MLSSLRSIVQEVNTAESLKAALDIIVRRVKAEMGTDVCSVYMLDPDTNRYVFAATEGLNKEAEGRLSLGQGEGLVGQVGKKEEPINLEEASKHPSFQYLPESGEDNVKSFLGVPIIHHRKVLGVLVVQQSVQRKFDESEEAFLVTVSAQLAAVIAHAQATGAFQILPHDGGVSPASVKFTGVAASSGIAIGTAVVISPPADLRSVPNKSSADPNQEMNYFNAALQAVRNDIQNLGSKLSNRLAPEERALFDVYLSMLDDNALAKEISDLIVAGEWAQGAVSQVILSHVRNFELMEDPYLKERAVDIHDLGRRLLAYLQDTNPEPKTFPERCILVGEELTASMLGEVPSEKLVGLVSVRGSGNSHVAILARSMGIPTVMGAIDLPYTRVDNRELIVDGYNGAVYTNASAELYKHYGDIFEEEKLVSRGLEQLKDLPCETTDGWRIPLFVNTGLMVDVMRSIDKGAEGVGLYRTEIPFLLNDRFPSEEEQRLTYREQLAAFHPRPVTMRTLDIGGDKPLPYFPIDEENPFLGWRGVRVTLDHPEIFLSQVRAMMKANVGLDNLQIMLPMISNVPELDEALSLIYRAHSELVEEGLAALLPPIGLMVEVPSAVYQARDLAKRVDFMSVGSNDLTQYLLAVDRNNPRVADLYHAYHPAVLKACYDVVLAGHAEGKRVSICGELAGDPAAAVLLLAMGFDFLSMNATNLLKVKSVLRFMSKDQAILMLDNVLTMASAREIQEYMEQALRDSGISRLFFPGSRH